MPNEIKSPISDLEEIDQVFKALAHPARRQVLLALHFRGGCVRAGDIASRFSCTWPTMTRHLGVLRDANLVQVTKRGRERFYELDRERLQRVVGDWTAWFSRDPLADLGSKTKGQDGNATSIGPKKLD